MFVGALTVLIGCIVGLVVVAVIPNKEDKK